MTPSRFSFFEPSAGDRLLSRATSCKVELHRWPAEALAGEEAAQPAAELSFEIRGEMSLNARDAGELLAALIREFRSPREGGAQ